MQMIRCILKPNTWFAQYTQQVVSNVLICISLTYFMSTLYLTLGYFQIARHLKSLDNTVFIIKRNFYCIRKDAATFQQKFQFIIINQFYRNSLILMMRVIYFLPPFQELWSICPRFWLYFCCWFNMMRYINRLALTKVAYLN